MLLQEQLRPHSLNDYIGSRQPIQSARLYLENKIKKKALLLIGPAGTGKTTLAHCLAKEYNFSPLEMNGSQERNTKDIDKIIQARKSQSISFDFKVQPRLLIVDECEGMDTKNLTKLLNLKGKKILIANTPPHYNITQECHQVPIPSPKPHHFAKFLKQIDSNPSEDDLNSFTSWRDCINWYYGGDSRNTTQLSEHEEAREILTQNRTRSHYNITTEKLLDYFIHNGGDQEIGSLLFEKMQQNKILKRVVRDVIFSLYLPSVSKIGWFGTGSKTRKRVKLLGFLE